MNKITICENIAEPDSWQTFDTDQNVCEFLMQHYSEWPKTARVYHNNVAESNDVTPHSNDESTIERLKELEGQFYVVVYPGDPVTILVVVAVAVSAISILAAFLLRPKLPEIANQQQGSPNNSLSDRQNKQRPNERIPDIYGTLWATPDLIMVPYRVFISNREVEYSYMCLGRGNYDIAVIRDDTTPVNDIDGVGVEVYGPNTSPNSGDAPQMRVGPLTLASPSLATIPGTGYITSNPRYRPRVYFEGENGVGGVEFVEQFGVHDIYRPYTADVALKGNYSYWSYVDFAGVGGWTRGFPGGYTGPSDPRMQTGDLPLPDDTGSSSVIRNIKRSNSVNGQVLIAPNSNKWKPSGNVTFVSPDAIETTGDVDFTNLYAVGNNIILTNALADDSGAQPTVDLSGTYVIAALTPNQIVLVTPSAVNANWGALAAFTGAKSLPGSPIMISTFDGWVGPFILDDPYMKELWGNFVAPQGLYEVDSKNNQLYMTCDVELGVQAIDSANNPVGDEHFFVATVAGSSNTKTQRGTTLRVILPLQGPCRARARRRSNTDLRDGYSVVDQIQWRDAFSVSDVDTPDFGNITTLLAVAWPTQDALAIKERKINCLVSKKGPTRAYKAVGAPTAINLKIRWTHNQGTPTCDAELNSGNINSIFTGSGYVFDTSAWSNRTDTILLSVFDGNHNFYADGGIESGAFFIGSVYTVTSTAVLPTDDVIVHDIWIEATMPDGTIITYRSNKVDLFPTSGGTATAGGGNIGQTSRMHVAPAQAAPQIKISGWYGISVSDPTSKYVGYDLTGPIATHINAADIIAAMALDPYIGGRTPQELDWNGIYDTAGNGGEIETYFGTPLCTEFCYTFDDAGVSFEEMLASVASAVFSTAYRRGNKISIFFEKLTALSTILFNHRNKVPNSETRTVNFGTVTDNDGFEIDYIDPNAPNAPNIDTTVTLYFPVDKSATSPKKIKLIGVRNNVQAYLLGWRMFNKLLYQNTNVQFNALKEAAVSILTERILVADNTRPDTQDGEVTNQVSLELTLSQPVTFIGGRTYVIFLQYSDGTVESIGITAGSAANKVVLAGAPSLPLVMDADSYARTTYVIVDNVAPRSNAFLLQEKTPQDHAIYELKAINYDDRYYSKDGDFISLAVVQNSHAGAYNAGYAAPSPDNVPPAPPIDATVDNPNAIIYRITANGV